MEQKVAQAAQDLADALKAHVADEAKLRGASEDAAQKALAAEYKEFEAAVKARREKFESRFNDADDDVATIDNPTGKYLRFAVEGDDYILAPGSNKVVSYSFGIPASRVAALASAQLFAPHGITMTITKGKSTLNREKLLADAAESAKKEAEERAALEQRLKAERSVKEGLTANMVKRIESQAAADIMRTVMPAPAPVKASEVPKGAKLAGTPVEKDEKEGRRKAKAKAKATARKTKLKK